MHAERLTVPSVASPSLAAHLLVKLVRTGRYDEGSLAIALLVSKPTLLAFVAGELVMPLETQLCLALLVIEEVRPLARLGYRLKSQVLATITCRAVATDTPMRRPPRARWAQ